MTEDFYDLLDVDTDASQSEIKQAFREQVRVYHPDLNDDDRAQAQFTALKRAYDILGDPVERRAYDRLGHEDYVAKRTSGLPSPEVWRSGGSEDEPGETETERDGAGRPTGTGDRSDRRGGDPDSTSTRDRLVRWWHRRNFAWPLIYAATLAYVAGLGHYGLENAAALESLGADLASAGADPEAAWAILGEGRHGLPTVDAFLRSARPVAVDWSPAVFYGTLAGLVAVALLVVVLARHAWRRDTWGPVSLDETIVVAVALGLAGTLAGGALAAGMLLMPLLFGVVVRRTRQLPGWAPSYGYVLGVTAPLVGLVATVAGVEPSLRWEPVAFVVVPVLAALGLPVRARLRGWLGR